jgi:hypothetical protein
MAIPVIFPALAAGVEAAGGATAVFGLLGKLALSGGIVSGLAWNDYITTNPVELLDKLKSETYGKALEGEEISSDTFDILSSILLNEVYELNLNEIPFDGRDSTVDYGTLTIGPQNFSLTSAEKGVILKQLIQQGDLNILSRALPLYQIIQQSYQFSDFINAATGEFKRLANTPTQTVRVPVKINNVEDFEKSEQAISLYGPAGVSTNGKIIASNTFVSQGLVENPLLPVNDSKEEIIEIARQSTSVRSFEQLLLISEINRENLLSSSTPIEQFIEYIGIVTTPGILQKSVGDLLLESYAAFILNVIDQDLLNRPIGSGVTSDNSFQSAAIVTGQSVYETVVSNFEDQRRIQLIIEALTDSQDREANLDDQQQQQAETRALNSLLDITDNIPPEEELTEEQRDANLAIVSQCALLLNIKTLKEANREDILQNIDNDYHNGIPYDGRFVMVENPENNLSAINKMLANKDLGALFELENREVSQLVPKIRLFKISQDGSNETEFIFPQTEDVDRKRNFITRGPTFFSSDFDKGSGAGIKEFSFNFNGTTPATSRNDVECSLTLFFQTFNDFIRTRKDYNGNEYRFIDLVIQPPADTKSKSKGFLSRLEYRPEFYKIRAEVGYYIPDNFPIDKRDAIMKSNASLVLTMVDHDININNDGTVEISLSYRAYIESALKSYRYDALATPEITSRRIQRAEQYLEILSRDACTQEELNQIKRAYEAEEEQLTKLSLRSIFRRLINNEKVHTLNINPVDRNRFIRNGSFEGIPRLTNLQNQIIQETPQASDALDTLEEVSLSFVNNLLEAEPGSSIDTFDRTDEINFFYLGDLLYVILDNINTDIPGLQQLGNTKIILSSLDIPSYRSNGQPTSINIADIPVSVDYFYEWYTDQVLAKGQTRRTFPILVFIRELCNRLITPALLENCYNRNLEKKLRFQSSSITIYDPNDKLGEEIESRVENGNLAIDLSNSQNIPFYSMDYSGVDVGDPNTFRPDPSEMSTLLIIYPVGKPSRHEGTGKYLQDIDRGCFHIDIGRNKGIVKTVNFNKTDMQYVREARFVQQNGISDILQLSAVYKTTVEMVGNTIFYPGMELYINPFGVGGTEFGSPTDTRSIANKLGFGGYHTIISVNSRITPGNFSTSVTAQQYYSGDGRTRAAQAGEHITPTDVNIETAPTNRDQTFCNVSIQAAEGDLARLTAGDGSPLTNIEKIDEIARNRSAEQSQPLAESPNRTLEETRAAIAAGNQIDLDNLSSDQDIDFDFQPSEGVSEQADAEANLPTQPSPVAQPSIPATPEIEEMPDELGTQPLSMDVVEQEMIRFTYQIPTGMQLINLRNELEQVAREGNLSVFNSLEVQNSDNQFLVYSIANSKETGFGLIRGEIDSILSTEQMILYPRDGGGETYIELSEDGNFFLIATILTREVVSNG